MRAAWQTLQPESGPPHSDSGQRWGLTPLKPPRWSGYAAQVKNHGSNPRGGNECPLISRGEYRSPEGFSHVFSVTQWGVGVVTITLSFLSPKLISVGQSLRTSAESGDHEEEFMRTDARTPSSNQDPYFPSPRKESNMSHGSGDNHINLKTGHL